MHRLNCLQYIIYHHWNQALISILLIDFLGFFVYTVQKVTPDEIYMNFLHVR